MLNKMRNLGMIVNKPYCSDGKIVYSSLKSEVRLLPLHARAVSLSRFPTGWIPSRVKNGQDFDFTFCLFEEHCEREPLDDDSPEGFVNNGKVFGVSTNSLYGFVDAENKLRTETLSLMFVPHHSISKFTFSFGVKSNGGHLDPRNSALMSSQERPRDGSDAKE